MPPVGDDPVARGARSRRRRRGSRVRSERPSSIVAPPTGIVPFPFWGGLFGT